MGKVKEDAQGLIHPNFDPQENEQTMHAATRKAIETVKSELQTMTKTYQELMTTCQQKRDLFIVCVRFHMTIRKVCMEWGQELIAASTWVSACVYIYTRGEAMQC